jgi:pimeloyl-ACP methyl ester carboxylesterase
MEFVDLDASPLAPGVSPVRVHYREYGAGEPLIVLHGGWGYGIYPYARQIAALQSVHRLIIPDRTGYGGSGTLDVQRTDFHQRAAEETIAFMNALGIPRASLWGHSDGAVIALRLGDGARARLGDHRRSDALSAREARVADVLRDDAGCAGAARRSRRVHARARAREPLARAHLDQRCGVAADRGSGCLP